ncbi:MAG TPA: hypothetical protein VNO50_12780 [Pyrinomonadaceae bacterium]|nr:hypothetical protein [Pyrinomonadaceae bacterium]
MISSFFSSPSGLRPTPPVCHPPPPVFPPPPPPGVLTDCCPILIPLTLTMVVTNNLFCPGFTGQSLILTYDGGIGKWEGNLTIGTRAFNWKLSCPSGSTGPLEWMLQTTSVCQQGPGLNQASTASCDPFLITFNVIMPQLACPEICSGFVRNWRADITF